MSQTAAKGHWRDPYERIRCVCDHPEDSHVQEEDQGWCTLPVGKCIWKYCPCTQYEHSPENSAAEVERQEAVARGEAFEGFGDGRYVPVRRA